ncbi:MAG: HEPN domain-containing protein [Bacteroidales bacterium]
MTENIKLLLEKSEEFLRDAMVLLENKGYSSSVSRSYYAMFHSAQAMLLSENVVAHTHKGVMLNFSQAFIKTGRFDLALGKAFC